MDESLGSTCAEAFTVIQKMFNDTLQDRNREYQNNQRLNQRHQKLTEQMKTFSDKFKKDSAELDCRRKENESLRCRRQELLEEINGLETEIKKRDQQWDTRESYCKELEKKKEVQEANCRMMQYLQQENADLKEHLQLAECAFQKTQEEGEAEFECLVPEVENLRKKNAMLLERKEFLQDSYNESCKNHADGKQDMECACNRVVELDKELHASEERVEDLQCELYCIERELIDIEKRQAAEGRMKRKHTEKEALRQRQAEFERLKMECIRQRQAEFERLKQKEMENVRQKRAEIEKLKRQHCELETLLRQRQGHGKSHHFMDAEMNQSCVTCIHDKPNPLTPRHRSNPCASRACSSGLRSRFAKKKSHYSSDGLAPGPRQHTGRFKVGQHSCSRRK